MKTYDVRYEVGDEVYILLSKKIFKSYIDGIKVTETKPYKCMKGRNNEILEFNGITISYLVMTHETKFDNGCSEKGFDYYDQADLFGSKEELIANIKNL